MDIAATAGADVNLAGVGGNYLQNDAGYIDNGGYDDEEGLDEEEDDANYEDEDEYN